jgi:cell wall-associated NlpC family hydrolase
MNAARGKTPVRQAAKPVAKRTAKRVAFKTKKFRKNFSTRRISTHSKKTSKRSLARAQRNKPVETPAVAIPSHPAPLAPAPCLTCSHSVLEVAASFTGLRYRRGGSTPETGFDCSGFVKYVFESAQALLLPRSASQQFTQGTEVARGELAQGDLVFFRRGRSHWHVGIYHGDNQFIHSPNSRESIKLTSLDTPYYRRYFIGARRLNTARLAGVPAFPLPLSPSLPAYGADDSDFADAPRGQ